jgi:hypothetical protein
MSGTTLHHRTARAAIVAASAALGTALTASAAPADAQRPATDCATVAAATTSDDIGLVVAARKAAAAQYLVDHWVEIHAHVAR